MPIERIESPQDALTTNQWILEINGERYASFSKVDGLGVGVGTTERADGGTGRKIKFHDNVINVDQITLTRVVDPADAKDSDIDAFLQNSIENNQKYDGSLIKYHNGSELFRIRFEGLLFVKETYPSMDKVTGALFEITYTVECDGYEKVSSST